MSGVTVDSRAIQELGSATTTQERVKALTAILDTGLVARATKVSTTAVRNWAEGTEPRTDPAMTVDDLRSIVAVLVDGGFEPPRVRSWLLSRDFDWLEGKRPLDEISRVPAVVLSAATDSVLVHQHGPAAAAGVSKRQGAASSNGGAPEDNSAATTNPD
jgi:hypothetical protein